MEISSIIIIISIILSSLFVPVRNHSFNNSRDISYRHTFRKLLAIDWCKQQCSKGENIGCTYKGVCTPKDPCKFETVDKEKVLSEHNRLRNLFASGKDPSAKGLKVADMNKLQWDDELAFLAGCNLVPCAGMEHDPCHTTPKFPRFVGQNLWIMTSTNPDLDCGKESLEGESSAAQAWYDEIKLTTKKNIEAYGKAYEFVHDIGHFTQLIWAKVTHVGCSLTRKTEAAQVTCQMACNYGPGGNIIQRQMFTQGSPCSICPEGLTCDGTYPSLCGTGTGTMLRSNIVYLLLSCLVISCQCYHK